jgi:hypothetical protein
LSCSVPRRFLLEQLLNRGVETALINDHSNKSALRYELPHEAKPRSVAQELQDRYNWLRFSRGKAADLRRDDEGRLCRAGICTESVLNRYGQ